MPARETEAIILRTYPLREADKIVSLFSRTYGKLRGVARGAAKPKSRYGAALECMSYVRLGFFEKENADLFSIDHIELLGSSFATGSAYEGGVVLAHLSEITEQLLPEREPQDAFFRLLLLTLEEIRRAGTYWAAVTYFDLWAVRLGGFLPDLTRTPAIGAESRGIAAEMLRKPLADLEPRVWKKAMARDLRRHLERLIEEHIERRLVTRPLLEQID